MITISLPDGSSREYPDDATGSDIASSISDGLARSALAIVVDDEVFDLNRPISKDAKVRILTFDDPEGKEVFWHSSAHVLAQAVRELFPDAKLTIGPAIDEGFYYDIDHEPFSEEDLGRITERMREVAKRGYEPVREAISKADARALFADNPYKLELIDEYEHEELTIYRQGEFVDLCRGPHIPSTKRIKAIEATRTSGAYWRGDAKNAQLQRIYGVSYPKAAMLAEYHERMKAAEERNHRRIGREMELFDQFDLIGKGLPVWLPKGEVMRQQIESLAISFEDEAGYVRVNTPHLGKKELFEASGHLPYYEDDMYPAMVMDDGTYYLKAMNCPMHHLIFTRAVRSYRELPLRIAEYGTCYRNELSGTLNGLLRVRSLRMNDAHIYCRKDQIESEVRAVIDMIARYFALFGLNEYWFRLSLGDRSKKEKYIDEPENWDSTEAILRNVLDAHHVPYREAVDEAAFYGPKIDVQFRNVFGREETMSTVQLDFAAKSRFGMSYIDETGARNDEVYVIHRAPLSTHERFMAFLIEHFAGKFPLWLAPEQVVLIPVSDAHRDAARSIAKTMTDAQLRVRVDDRSESVSYRVRDAQLKRTPFSIVIGEREAKGEAFTPRSRENEVLAPIDQPVFVSRLAEKIRQRDIDLAL